jgi:hypothetical protein
MICLEEIQETAGTWENRTSKHKSALSLFSIKRLPQRDSASSQYNHQIGGFALKHSRLKELGFLLSSFRRLETVKNL